MFRPITSVHKLLAMKARKRVVQGSTSAGKTYSIVAILIDRAGRVAGRKITIVCGTIPGCKEVAEDIFKPIMKDTNRWHENRWTGSPMQYQFANGSRIQFKAFDSKGKARQAGKRDILFINEANNIPYEIADTLMTRSKEIWLDFNADVEFWAHTEVLKEKNSELLVLTYQDNEKCSAEVLDELEIKKDKAYFNPHLPDEQLGNKDNIKSEYWHNWWNVFGRGLIGNISELRIMPLLNKGKYIPDDAIEIPSALDYGWFPHQTAFARLFVKPGDRKLVKDRLYIYPLVYETKLTTNSKAEGAVNLVDILEQKKVNKKNLIIAESAEPGTNSEMYLSGFNIEAVKKTLVATTIRLFHDYDIEIIDDGTNHPEAEACYFEFDQYKFKMDKIENKILKVPAEDQPDHFIDGVRYVLMSKDSRWELPKPKPEKKAA